MKTLEELLEWAKEMKMYIEIFGDGSAEVQFDPDFNYGYETYAEGGTLLAALLKAKEKFEEGK